MNPCVMSAVKITHALGIEGGVRSVTVTDNGGGFVVMRSDARIEWHTPADFARLVESRRVKPWQNERDANEDEYEAREMLRKAAMEWILNLWEGRGESTHLRARFILARIGFRKVMADIAGKGKPEQPGELTVRELVAWLEKHSTAWTVDLRYTGYWEIQDQVILNSGNTIAELAALVRGG